MHTHRVGSRRFFEIKTRVGDVVESLLGVAFETPAQQAEESRRSCARERRPLRLPGEDDGEDVAHGFAGEETFPGEHLEEHHTERPDVGALVAHGQASRSTGLPRACSGLM